MSYYDDEETGREREQDALAERVLTVDEECRFGENGWCSAHNRPTIGFGPWCNPPLENENGLKEFGS